MAYAVKPQAPRVRHELDDLFTMLNGNELICRAMNDQRWDVERSQPFIPRA